MTRQLHGRPSRVLCATTCSRSFASLARAPSHLTQASDSALRLPLGAARALGIGARAGRKQRHFAVFMSGSSNMLRRLRIGGRRARLRAKLSSLRLQGLHGDYAEAPAALKLAAGTSATATAMCRQWKALQSMPRELAQASLCREVANLLWS